MHMVFRLKVVYNNEKLETVQISIKEKLIYFIVI